MQILANREVATSLSRIFTHVKDDLFCCITAFRSDIVNTPSFEGVKISKEDYERLCFSLAQKALPLNRKRNKILFAKIRELGYGFAKIAGKYKEKRWFDGKVHNDDDEGIENVDFFYLNVSEESAIVLPQKDVDQNLFIKQMIGLMTIQGLTQDGILIKPRESMRAYEIMNKGKQKRLFGDWHPNIVAGFMSATKKGRNSTKIGTFNFEWLGEVQPMENL